jgi:hypothetical protein
MKNKNSLSESEQAESKAARIDSEKKLLPRLKFMGYVMSILCAATVTFAIVAPEQPESEAQMMLDPYANKPHAAGISLENEDELLELTPAEVLNYYVISAVFALVGGACFFICWRKEKHFFLKSKGTK